MKSTKKEQLNLLIADAKTHGLMPVYCFNATEAQRAMGSRRSMIKDMLSNIQAGFAVRERLLAMCNDRHLVSQAVRIALASAHPAV